MQRLSPTIAWLTLLLSAAPVSAQQAQPTGAVHVLDVTSLTAAELDELYAAPALERWIELGNTTLAVGSEALPGILDARLRPGARRTVTAEIERLRLARLEAAHAVEDLPAGTELVAGFGRYAVVALPDDGPSGDAEVAPTRVTAHTPELNPVPWNTVLIRRPDRQRASSGAARSSANAALIDEAVGGINGELYTSMVLDLVNFGTRYTHASSFPNVTEYARAKFEAMGLTPTLEPFQIGGRTRHNVIAEIPGSVTPDDVWVVCGHIDSTSQNPSNFAPGADDNASGSAAVIEMARVLSGFRFDSTLRFICFSGEEQGLVGSNAHVNRLKQQGQLGRVKGVINMDMIAYKNTGVNDVLIEGGAQTSQAMMSLLSGLVSQHTNLVPFTSTNPFGSDHMPYINNGVNAVLTIEYQDWFNPNYHTTSDTFNTLTIPLALDIVRLNIAGIATGAGINGYASRGVAQAYGQGLGGANIGTISTRSIPNLGTELIVDASGFTGSSSLQLLIATSQASTPMFGGTLLIDVATRIGMRVAPVSNGDATFVIALPSNPSVVGSTAYMQAGGGNPTQPAGVAMSNGLAVTLGQ